MQKKKTMKPIRTVALITKSDLSRDPFLKEIRKNKFKISETPDAILACGGDGTLLAAVHKYPSVPVLFIRTTTPPHTKPQEEVHSLAMFSKKLRALRSCEYSLREYPLIKGRVGGRNVWAINDIVIRNKHPTHAIRFIVKTNFHSKQFPKHVGDGIVVSTPLGSTGYFNSITRKHFSQGLGVAFNNTIRPEQPLLLSSKSRIICKILRGNATLSADNVRGVLSLKENDTVRISQSKKFCRLIHL